MNETISFEGREVSAIFDRPEAAVACLVFGHGAGAGMRHAFMNDATTALAAEDVATLRYQFPYMERGARMPDGKPTLEATVRAAVDHAAHRAHELPIFAGGKSMGGRITSLACSKHLLPAVRGLVFFGFPLHPAKKPSDARAAHLADVHVPMLFLQGTRDALAELSLLRPVVEKLGARDAMHVLHVIEGADHGFAVPARSGRTHADVLRELASTTARWMKRVLDASPG